MSADSISWPKTPDEIYSIKSGYKLILEDGEDVAGVATAEVIEGVWSRIWKLKVPNHVRNLLWRAGNDSLPTKANLLKRKLLDDVPTANLAPRMAFMPYSPALSYQLCGKLILQIYGLLL